MSLQGKVAVVTGGGSGLGRACSIQLARDGAAVAIWDLNEQSAGETAGMIAEAGGKAIACAVDAADQEAIARQTVRTREELGPVSILVNNAGITGFRKFQELTEDELIRMFRINSIGPFLWCSQAVLPDMLEAGWGRIINISSSSAQTGAATMTHYSASKGAVIAFTKSLAQELADKGITVNNIPPGFIDTPMLRGSPVDVDQQSAASPMKRPGRPEDIAAACSYLASDAAGYVTGQTLGVNGGRVMP